MSIEIKEGYKKTKLGWIPEEWKIESLLSLGEFSKGKGVSKSELVEFGIPAIRYGEIYTEHDFYLKEYKSFVSEESASKSKPIQKGDLLFAGSGETNEDIGKCVAIVDDTNGVAGGDIIIFRNHNESTKFLGFQLNSIASQRQTYKFGQGHSVVHIYSSSLKNLLLALPPLPEQKKIADILSTWDKAIETTQALIEKLQLRKKGLMQQLLSGKKRLPGFSLPTGQVGGEWEEFSLGDVSNRLTKKNVELNDNVVTISAQRGFVRQEDFFNKRVASKTLSGYYLIDRGHFAYNKSYSKGYPMGAFKRLDDFDKAVVTTLYICFEITENADSDFMLYYFEGGMLVRNLMKIAQEGGRAHGLLNISLGDFFELKMILPPKQEQTAIAQVLCKADEEINQARQYLEQLQEQKKGLMQQLLTGQRRVTV